MDLLAGVGLKKLFFKQVRGTNYRTHQTLNTCIPEVLVLGSSRASHHYNPQPFYQAGMSSFYNGGRDGTLFEYNLACIQSILKRHHPKMIIADLNFEDFYENNKPNENLRSIIPFYHTNPELQHLIIEVRGKLEPLKQWSRVYPYNSTLLNSISNIVRAPNPQDTVGYMPLEGTMDQTSVDTVNFENSNFNLFRLDLFKRTIALCAKKKVELVFVQSPRYTYYQNHKIEQMLKVTTTQNAGRFFSFANDTFFMSRPFLFKDQSHLNDSGATIFSKILIEKITQHAINK